jgi:hypothetical protein
MPPLLPRKAAKSGPRLTLQASVLPPGPPFLAPAGRGQLPRATVLERDGIMFVHIQHFRGSWRIRLTRMPGGGDARIVQDNAGAAASGPDQARARRAGGVIAK